jgi:L-glyceraldehyde 3-phosphate reductase
MALAWILSNSLVTSVIVGASSIGQLDSNLQSIRNTSFSAEEIEQINALTI